MQRINRQINWGINVCYMRKRFERSIDLLVKSNTLPAELLISQISVSKLRNDISLLKSDGTESFSLSGNVLVRKNNRTEQLILLRSSSRSLQKSSIQKWNKLPREVRTIRSRSKLTHVKTASAPIIQTCTVGKERWWLQKLFLPLKNGTTNVKETNLSN